MSSLTIVNFNASRTRNLQKLEFFLQFLKSYNPNIVTIQEINVESALKIFSSNFQIIINIEMEAKDGVGSRHNNFSKKRYYNHRFNNW